MADLGYSFKYIYDIIGKQTNSKKAADYAIAAAAAAGLRSAKVGMAGYRDMNLYGTLYDGPSLKRVVGVEIETFEMLEIKQRYDKIPDGQKQAVVDTEMSKWKFLKEAKKEGMLAAAG
jgi:L-fucose isomerase-like protein